MGNLIRMDLYRMRKAKSFIICLILAFVLAVSSTPLGVLLTNLAKSLSTDPVEDMPATVNLIDMVRSPASSIEYMLCLLSVVFFFYADLEAGYIKNIAGQMPKKGFSVLSRFLAAIPHNLLFMLVALVGGILGSLPFQKIIVDGSLIKSIGYFLLKLALLQGVTSILLLVTTSFRSKSLGMILAVLMGLSLMGLIYTITIDKLIGLMFSDFGGIAPYMPDTVLQEDAPVVLRAILVSAITIAVFLGLSIRVFDRRDVK